MRVQEQSNFSNLGTFESSAIEVSEQISVIVLGKLGRKVKQEFEQFKCLLLGNSGKARIGLPKQIKILFCLKSIGKLFK
jgi:hypothetical protein